MQRINRGIDTTGTGTARQLCIAGLFSLLFLLATVTHAQGACTDCHYPGGMGPLPHDAGCQTTSCAQACHTSQDVNRHPTSAYTPWEGGAADRTTICRTCHDKPWPEVYHPYTINVSAGSITPPGSVDLDQACGQCHGGGTDPVTSPPKKTPDGQYDHPYYNKTVLGSFAENIHLSKPIARFSFAYDPATSFKVNFSAGNTTCPSGSCTYAWNFGGSPTDTGTGITTSKQYPSTGGPFMVVLTVSDTANSTSGTTSQGVTPQAVNAPPVAAFSAAPAISGFGVSFTDASTDAETAQASLAITVNWGDGTTSSGVGGGPFSHNYASAGTFTIALTAADAGGRFNTAFATGVTVPTKYSISGKIFDSDGTTGLSGAAVTLKLNGATKATMTTVTGGSYSFGNLNLGAYTVTAYKYGMVFDNDVSGAPYTNPISVTVGPDATDRNFTRVAPYTVTVNTSPALSAVTVTLKQGSSTKYAGTTNAAGTKVFTNVAPGTYNVQAVKTGYAFDGDAVIGGNQNPVTVTGPATVTFTHTP